MTLEFVTDYIKRKIIENVVYIIENEDNVQVRFHVNRAD